MSHAKCARVYHGRSVLLQATEQTRFLGLLRLLRLLRLSKLWGKLDQLSAITGGLFRIAGLVGFFLLLGALAIRPVLGTTGIP